MKYFDCNLVVIGVGFVGLVSVYIVVMVKVSVMLIEKGEMGGDCLNIGCVLLKVLIKSVWLVYLE